MSTMHSTTWLEQTTVSTAECLQLLQEILGCVSEMAPRTPAIARATFRLKRQGADGYRHYARRDRLRRLATRHRPARHSIQPNGYDICQRWTARLDASRRTNAQKATSDRGHKRKSRPCGGMSASPPIADIGRTFPEVRLVPNSEVSGKLLDHLVGADQQRSWDIDANFFRSLEVHHQFEPGRLFDRQVGWLGSLEDFVHIRGGVSE